jgi:hypothetical protein
MAMMAERNWVLELEVFLAGKFSGLFADSEPSKPAFPDYSPAFEDWEAEYFLRGLENGLFSVDQACYVQSNFLPSPARGSDRQKTIQLFWSGGSGRRFLFREGICQLATASHLSIFHRFKKNQIEMEPNSKSIGSLANSIDILVRNHGEATICCEVKRNCEEFDELINGFKYCCSAGFHEKKDCKFEKNHPKYAVCRELKPKYFYAISPGQKLYYRLDYVDDKISLQEIYELPSP